MLAHICRNTVFTGEMKGLPFRTPTNKYRRMIKTNTKITIWQTLEHSCLRKVDAKHFKEDYLVRKYDENVHVVSKSHTGNLNVDWLREEKNSNFILEKSDDILTKQSRLTSPASGKMMNFLTWSPDDYAWLCFYFCSKYITWIHSQVMCYKLNLRNIL